MVAQVVLVDHTINPEAKIASYAATCYNSKTDEESNERRIKNLLKQGHLATLRFAYATFEVSSITRICSHQFVRSKHLDFLQQSQRYVNQKNVSFTTPPEIQRTLIKNRIVLDSYVDAVVACYNTYDLLINNGIKKEDARFILPESTNTKLVVTGNFQAWKDFLKLRKDKAAQWEIYEVARQVELHLNNLAPNVFPIGE